MYLSVGIKRQGNVEYIQYYHDMGKGWDEGVPFVFFTIRDAKHESFGFSPATLGFGHDVQCAQLSNSAFLAKAETHLFHLPPSQCRDVFDLLHSNPSLFSDVPSHTSVCEHDINVGDTTPIT